MNSTVSTILLLNMHSNFEIETASFVFLISLYLAGPNQLPLKCFIHGNYHSGYRVEYTPVDVGTLIYIFSIVNVYKNVYFSFNFI